MKKQTYKKEGNNFTIGSIRDIEEIQDFLRKKGLFVSFHPRTLNIHHSLSKEDYKYYKESGLIWI